MFGIPLVGRIKMIRQLNIDQYHIRLLYMIKLTIFEVGDKDYVFNRDRCLCILNTIHVHAIRKNWSGIEICLVQLEMEMNICSHIMVNRLKNIDSDVGNLYILPMEIRELISSCIVSATNVLKDFGYIE